MRIGQGGLLMALALGLLLSIDALASQAGFRSVSVPGVAPDPAPIPVALFYPTQAPERTIVMGPFTVHLALGGGQPESQRLVSHCANNRADDPILCSLVRAGEPAVTRTEQADRGAPALADSRVRAVVAMAPLGAVISAQSLASIQVPTLIYEAELDRYLVPRFHAEWIARNVPGVELRRVPNAWHSAFMDIPGMSIPTPDGDIAADPSGFDRPAFLQRLSKELPAYFDQILDSAGNERGAQILK